MPKNYKLAIESLSKEFNKDLKFHIYPKSSGHNDKNSKIITRLLHLCDEKKTQNEERFYNLCKLVKYSFLDTRITKMNATACVRTVKLLTEECPIELTCMAWINLIDAADAIESPIIDLTYKRFSALESEGKVSKQKYLKDKIVNSFATDDLGSLYTKDKPHPYPHMDAIEIVITDHNIDELFGIPIILEYVSLCHTLEEFPLLLDLDPSFLCSNHNIKQQLNNLIKQTGEFLTSSQGIQILNGFGYKFFNSAEGQQKFKTLKEIPDILTILKPFLTIIKYLPVDFIIKNHLRLSNATINHSTIKAQAVKELILNEPDFFEAVKNSESLDLLKECFEVATIIDELKRRSTQSTDDQKTFIHLLELLIEKNIYTHEQWLDLIASLKFGITSYEFFVKIFIEKNIATHKTADKWIRSLNTKYRMQLYELLELENYPMNYFALYTLGPEFKKLPDVQRAIEIHRTAALTQLRTRYLFSERDQKQLETIKDSFKAPSPPILDIDIQLVNQTKEKMQPYQRQYLIIDKRGHATHRYFTPSARADAYNFIMPTLNKPYLVSSRLQKILEDTNFINNLDSNPGLSFHRSMKPIFEPLIKWSQEYKQSKLENEKYWNNRSNHCRKVKDNDFLLLELLLDLDVLNHLNTQEMAILFEYGNKSLFAETILRAYPGRELQPFSWKDKTINLEFLQSLIATSETAQDINAANQYRFAKNIPQYIPNGAKYVGANSSDAALSKEQLYQLQDIDLTGCEQYLSDEFKKSLIQIRVVSTDDKHYKILDNNNKIVKTKKTLSASTTSKSVLDEKNTNYRKLQQGYLLSISPIDAVLVDPALENKLKPRYTQFKNRISFIAKSLLKHEHYFLAGIANLNGNHYIPYFIFKNKLNIIHVFTLDPSFETSPVLEKVFKDIFPECHYQDGHIVQQVRQRDCGFNSLQVIKDVVSSLQGDNPILSWKNNTIIFDPTLLSVNGNPYRCYDYQKQQYFFLKELLIQGDKVRKEWAAILSSKKNIHYAETEMEYNYLDNVEKQQNEDEMGCTLSVISALMIDINILNNYRAQYTKNLKLPTKQQVEEIRQLLIKESNIADISEFLQSDDARDAIYTICKMNFKSDTGPALLNIFKDDYLTCCKFNQDQTGETIFDDFTKISICTDLETGTYTAFSDLAKLLSTPEYNLLRNSAIKLADEGIATKKLNLQFDFIKQYLHDNIEDILSKVNIPPSECAKEVMNFLRKNKETRYHVSELITNTHTEPQLNQYITQLIKRCVDNKSTIFWDFLSTHFDILNNPSVIEANKGLNLTFLTKSYKSSLLSAPPILNDKSDVIPMTDHQQLNESSESKIEVIDPPQVIALEPRVSAQQLSNKLLRPIPADSTFYQLVQNELAASHQHTYLNKIEALLISHVNTVIANPAVIDFCKQLSADEQYQLTFKQDYFHFFKKLETIAQAESLIINEDNYHAQVYKSLLNDLLRNQMVNIARGRYTNEYDQILSHHKLNQIIQSNNYFLRLEKLLTDEGPTFPVDKHASYFFELYANIHEAHLNKLRENLSTVTRNITSLSKLLNICNAENIFTVSNKSKFESNLAELQKNMTALQDVTLADATLKLDRMHIAISQYFDELVTQIYKDPRYIPGNVEPGCYTLQAQHLLCIALNIPQPKALLSSTESAGLDREIKHSLSQPQKNYFHRSASKLLTAPMLNKLPDSKDQILNHNMLLNYIYHWRGKRYIKEPWKQDNGLNRNYKSLVSIANKNIDMDLKQELPIESLNTIMEIAQNTISTEEKSYSFWKFCYTDSSSVVACKQIMQTQSIKKIQILRNQEFFYENFLTEALAYLNQRNIFSWNRTHFNHSSYRKNLITIIDGLKHNAVTEIGHSNDHDSMTYRFKEYIDHYTNTSKIHEVYETMSRFNTVDKFHIYLIKQTDQIRLNKNEKRTLSKSLVAH